MNKKIETENQTEHLIGYDEFEHTGTDLIRKRKRKQKQGFAVICVVIILVVTVSMVSFLLTRKDGIQQEAMPDMMGERPDSGIDMVAASGTTAVGVDAVTFEIDFLEETELYVEEVYLAAGDEVLAGEKYLKLTQASIAEARKELESTSLNADIAYRSSIISTKESEIQAKYDYEKILLEAEQAGQVYEDTLASLQAKVNSAQKAYEEAQEALNDFSQALTNNTYDEEYEVEVRKKAYEDANELYIIMKEDWAITDTELSGTSAATETASSAAVGQKTQTDTEKKWQVKTIKLLKEEAEEAEQEYEQAMSAYENALKSANLNLQKLQNALETARQDLTDAKLCLEKEGLSAKTAYETALAKKQTAKNEYDTQLTSLEEEQSKLQDAREEAADNLALFEATVGDGYLYTENAGTIIMIRAQENTVLTGGDMILAYSNPEEISVSVSVSQEYISKLYIGEAVKVSIADQGEYTGTIVTINPVSSGDSKTTVTYTVQVELEGDVSALSANLTATVIFGAGATGT